MPEITNIPPTVHGRVLTDDEPVAPGPAALLDLVSLVMDRLFLIPGTRTRFGLNSLFMVLPVLGDIIPALVSFGILAVGLGNYRVPRIVAVRMVLNSMIDASLGWIPVLGDVFDLYFKADTRNVRLLQEHLGQGQPRTPAWQHWLFVAGLLGAFVAVLVLVGLGAAWLITWMFRGAPANSA